MSKFKFYLHEQGVRELMQSEEMQEILEEKANEMLGVLGEGYTKETRVGYTRANTNVIADSYEARIKNLKHNTLLKAVK